MHLLTYLLIPTDLVPAVTMNDWHVARHLAAGDGFSSVKIKMGVELSTFKQLVIR